MKHPILSLVTLALFSSGAAAQKLQVYVLAGQSNMVGHAKVTTFDYIGDDQATAPLLAEMRDEAGAPRVSPNVWISYLTGGRGGDGEGVGQLTAGYGARQDPTQDGGKIGPEFTFGIFAGKANPGPVLIIKTAWGGKSLHTDFRPPSAGPYPFTDAQLERFRERGDDLEQVKADKVAATGRYYRRMIDHVERVLADPGRVCPAYDAEHGYELAGFVWFQGWNDMVDRGTYPNRDKPGGYDRYSECLAHFIRDVRKDLSAPDMPFVIGVMGVGGAIQEGARNAAVQGGFRAAMAAPAALPEFRGTVVAVQTAPFWDGQLQEISTRLDEVKGMARKLRNAHESSANKDGTMSEAEQREWIANYRAEVVGAEDEAIWKRGASNAGYHYLGCSKTMAQIGKAFADAALALRR